MKEIFRIAFFIFKQGIREKVFIGLLFVFIFILGVCVFLGKISAGEEVRILRNAGLVGIEFSGFLIILFFITHNFYQQKYTRILDLFLVGFKRRILLTGYFLGYLLILFFFLVFSFLIFSSICLFYKAYYPGILVAGLFSFLRLSIMLSFCILFSCFFESPIISFLSTLFLYIASEVSYSASKIILTYGGAIQRMIVKALYRILPNMDKLNVKDLVSYGQYPTGEFLIYALIYSFIYILFLFFLSLFIFEKKEYA